MKKLSFVMLLGAMLLLGACQSDHSSSLGQESNSSQSSIDWSHAGPDAQKNQISFTDVKADVEQGAKFFDVRSEAEFNAGNFGITDNVPISDLQSGNLPEIPKDTKIYVHCLRGIRSAEATKILRDAGFTQVYDLGGLEQVEAIGGKIE